jgi:hypothetical protein
MHFHTIHLTSRLTFLFEPLQELFINSSAIRNICFVPGSVLSSATKIANGEVSSAAIIMMTHSKMIALLLTPSSAATPFTNNAVARIRIFRMRRFI